MLELIAAAGFYIEGATSYVRAHPPEQVYVTKQTQVLYGTLNGEPLYLPVTYDYPVTLHAYDFAYMANPYGRLALGYDWRFPKVTFDLQVMHQSSIVAGDRGFESVSLSVRWYPFK